MATGKRTLRYGGLSLAVPEDWTDRSQLVAVAKEDRGFSPSLIASSERSPARSAKVYADEMRAALERTLPGFTVQAECEASFAGLTGLLREHTFDAGGLQLVQFQLYLLRDGLAHTLTFTHRAEERHAAAEMATALFESAKLEPRAAPELRDLDAKLTAYARAEVPSRSR